MSASNKSRKIILRFLIVLVILIAIFGGAVSDRLVGNKIFDRFLHKNQTTINHTSITEQKILNEESVVVDVADKVSPSVVTIGITQTQSPSDYSVDPFFDPFGIFGQQQVPQQQQQQNTEQDIGSGFIVSADGLVVTNKHVVSDLSAKYKVITKDSKEFEVKNIYRDPVNDLAILKIEAKGLPIAEMGDSNNLKVGQFAIAIGTALGEFRHTVTLGVISGLGRGITAGSPLEGSTERLDNVIQTDAAINPGNSGGPLLNSAGQVIGVNVAVSQQGQSIGFALPINVIKESLKNFQATGSFERAYLGVRYQLISQDAALLNEVPQGALVREVIDKSPASKAGVKVGDIITKLDGTAIKENGGDLAELINQKKVGSTVELTIWRDKKEIQLKLTLSQSSQ